MAGGIAGHTRRTRVIPPIWHLRTRSEPKPRQWIRTLHGLRHRVRHVRLTALLAAIALTAGAATASAYWPGSPSAFSWGSVGQPDLSATAVPVTGQYPGAPPTIVSITVNNASTAHYTVTEVRPNLDALPASCPAGAWHFGTPAALPTIGPSSSITIDLPIAMTADAPDSCQGQSFTLSMSVHGVLR